MSHPNSIAAYQQERDAGNLSKRCKAILSAFSAASRWNGGMTDRDILEHLGFSDMNAVRPRLTELIKSGICEECGSVRDRATGKQVRLVRIKQPVENLELFG